MERACERQVLDSASAVAATLEHGTFPIGVDVASTASIRALVASVVRSAGGIDVLVNNAGVYDLAPLLEVTETSYDRLFQSTFAACSSCCKRWPGIWSRRDAEVRSSTSHRRPAAPYGRLGRPDEIAGAAVFLASSDAEYVIGQTLNVDGGNVPELMRKNSENIR